MERIEEYDRLFDKWIYTYDEKTKDRSTLQVTFIACEVTGKSLQDRYRLIPKGLKTYWIVNIGARDREGIYRDEQVKDYDPTIDKDSEGWEYLPSYKCATDYDWYLEATDENRYKLLAEIETRAFGAPVELERKEDTSRA